MRECRATLYGPAMDGEKGDVILKCYVHSGSGVNKEVVELSLALSESRTMLK